MITKMLREIQKYIVNPKIQYKYSSNNYIPELLLANSVVVDGETVVDPEGEQEARALPLLFLRVTIS